MGPGVPSPPALTLRPYKAEAPGEQAALGGQAGPGCAWRLLPGDAGSLWEVGWAEGARTPCLETGSRVLPDASEGSFLHPLCCPKSHWEARDEALRPVRKLQEGCRNLGTLLTSPLHSLSTERLAARGEEG